MFRSVLFNICFYFGSALWLTIFTPFLIIPKVAIYVARGWTGGTLWLLRVICGIKYEIRGAENISWDKPVVYAVKHQSAWETLALYYLLKAPAFIVKRELGWIPILGFYLVGTNMIAVNRTGGVKSFKKMIQDTKMRFSKNRSLVIFPEGTRTSPGEKGDYKAGIYSLYQGLGCEVIPVALNSGLYWPRRQFQKYPGTIVVEFLPPIAPGLPREVFMATLEEKIERASMALLPHPKLVLLDRDGVININAPTSVRHPGEFEFIPGSIEAIQLLNKAGIKVAVVTNQAGIGRGHITEDTLKDIHAHMCKELEKAVAHIDHIFYCPDVPEANSHRRKPNPGMLEEALKMFQANPATTPMVGDDIRDLMAAAKVGCPRHVVLTGHGEKTIKDPEFKAVQPVHIHKDLLAVVKLILGKE